MTLPGRELLAEALAGLARGFSYTPTAGKAPFLPEWNKRQRSTPEQIREWIGKGYNLAVVTGATSGVLVIDVDVGKGADFDIPIDVPQVQSGGDPRNRHLYYAFPGDVGCPTTFAKHVEIKGEGGNVIAPGSIHPDTKMLYRWAVNPTSPLPQVPEEWLARMRPNVIQIPIESRVTPSSYGEKALQSEADRVATASDGERHAAQLRAGARIGQLIASGHVDEAKAEQTLIEAGIASNRNGGKPNREKEIVQAVKDGIKRGKQTPRSPQPRHPQSRVPDALPADLASRSSSTKPTILVPGPHVTDQGEYFEVGTDTFTDAALVALPAERIWRRAGVGGELLRSEGKLKFTPLARHRTRGMLDTNLRLVRWVRKKNDEGDEVHAQVFQPASGDNADLVISRTADHPNIPDLDVLTHYPVCMAPDFRVTKPGYNPGPPTSIYYDAEQDPEVHPIESVHEIRAILEDLVVDFPFGSPADRANFFGLLFTPFVRPALRGNVPMHLATSPVERTGKSKLFSIVFGGIVLGTRTPALQFTGSDDERDKRILADLLEGQTVANLDNIPGDFIDSPVLASLLTTETYRGRILGVSQMVSAPNRMTILASGNNVRATGEIAKRVVPIFLMPREERPDNRTEFIHPDLHEYVLSVRPRVRNAIFGAIELWRAAGCPLSKRPIGGFEDWGAVLGGILCEILGYHDWLRNREEWVSGTDDFGADLAKLVEEWAARHGSSLVSGAELMALAKVVEVFPDVIQERSEPANLSAFGKRVLKRAAGRIVGGWKIASTSSGNARRFSLRKAP